MSGQLVSKLESQILAIPARSHVSLGEGRRLAWLAERVPAGGAIVEIGSHVGRSAAFMAAALLERPAGRRVYCIDLWEQGGVRTPLPHHQAGVMQQFVGNMEKLGLSELVQPLQGDSVLVAKSWLLPIWLLFIDGSHAFEDVCADLRAWSRFVPTGGVLVLHDFNQPAVAQAVDREAPPWAWLPIDITERLWQARRI